LTLNRAHELLIVVPIETFFGGRRVVLEGATASAIFEAAALVFTDRLVLLDTVEPRRAEELDVEAPELDVLLVDFLTELLYRFDTRRWLTRSVQAALREQDTGWILEATLWGERLDPLHHEERVQAGAEVACTRFGCEPGGERWEAVLVFRATPPTGESSNARDEP